MELVETWLGIKLEETEKLYSHLKDDTVVQKV